jgi:hypothetical protein
VIKELGNALYLLFSFLEYLIPRTETYKGIAKLNKLYDDIVENKRKSMETGEIKEKIDNNSADLLDRMVYACNDPKNPTLTSDELRVSYFFCKFWNINI